MVQTGQLNAPYLPRLIAFFRRLRSMNLYFSQRRRLRFLSHFTLPAEGAVLDISCGDGCVLGAFHDHTPALSLHGIDMCGKAIGRAKKTTPAATFSVGRAESLPYPGPHFSVVISCNSFHHYDKPEQVFDEVSRVLSPDGVFYIKDYFPASRLTQRFSSWRGCNEPYHFEKYYTKKDIVALAGARGFALHAHTGAGWFSDTEVIALKKSF